MVQGVNICAAFNKQFRNDEITVGGYEMEGGNVVAFVICKLCDGHQTAVKNQAIS